MYSADEFERKVLEQAIAPVNVGRRPNTAPPAAPNPVAANPVSITDRRKANLKEMMDAYRAYEADKKISNLVKVYDLITHWLAAMWNHTSVRELGLREPGVRTVMESTQEVIQEHVSRDMAQNGTDATDAVEEVFKPDGKKVKPSKATEFFIKVGVPIQFYGKLTDAQVKLFRLLYTLLKKKKVDKVPLVLKKLADQKIVGFPLVKGLFLTYFSNVVGIDHLRSTTYESDAATKQAAFHEPFLDSTNYSAKDMKDENYAFAGASGKKTQADKRALIEENLHGGEYSKKLTNAEMKALTLYTQERYETYNAQLRGNDLSTPEQPGQYQHKLVKNQTSVLTSALNKLPQYSGTAYRMMHGFDDYTAAVKPGGVFTDLAFISASMTLQGAEIGGASGGAKKLGALETYVIIRTKAAANVTILGQSTETEVLFRPGTRFKVNGIWQHVNGKVPKAAPPEAQMILLRNGEMKTVTGLKGTATGKVRVVEMTEI
jgi:hypothetical protein